MPAYMHNGRLIGLLEIGPPHPRSNLQTDKLLIALEAYEFRKHLKY